MKNSKNEFLYQTINSNLKEAIIKGDYKVGSLLPTEREICEQYDVDRSTVRKALKLLSDVGYIKKIPGKGSVVLAKEDNIKTKEDIQISLNTVKTNNIGFFLPESKNKKDRITEPFNAKLFYSVQKFCQKHGFSVVYRMLGEKDSLEQIVKQCALDAAVFVSNIDEKHLEYAFNTKLPAVVVNSVDSRFPCITPNNTEGMYLATKYLLDLGHRDIAVVHASYSFINAKERLDGIFKAMSEYNIPVNSNFLIESKDWNYEAGFESVKAWVENRKGKMPTAIIGLNDRLALSAMHVMQQFGYAVPKDISIMGFDNSEDAIFANPKISSIEMHIDWIADIACTFLTEQLFSYKLIPVRSYVPVSLDVRDSVLDLRNKNKAI